MECSIESSRRSSDVSCHLIDDVSAQEGWRLAAPCKTRTGNDRRAYYLQPPGNQAVAPRLGNLERTPAGAAVARTEALRRSLAEKEGHVSPGQGRHGMGGTTRSEGWTLNCLVVGLRFGAVSALHAHWSNLDQCRMYLAFRFAAT